MVSELKRGKRAKQPTPAFITSTLQQAVSYTHLNLYAIAIEKRFAPKKVIYKGIYSFALGKLIEA